MQQLPLGVRLSKAARFDSFVAGDNREVVERLAGAVPPRVLWLWGRAGTGKSHLLQAACADAGERGGSATYVDLETATNPALLEGCESLDLVCLDSIDRASDDPAWNAAIFRLHTLMQDGDWTDARGEYGAPGLVAFPAAGPAFPTARGPGPPAVCRSVKKTRSRPSSDVRRRLGLELPRESASYLLHHLPRDMHTLCAMLDQLDEAALAAQRRLTVPFLRQVLDGHGSGTS